MTELRIACVFSTAAAGTGLHAAMLAHGCAARGLSVTAFGPAGTWHQFRRGDPGDQAGVRFAPVEIGHRPRPGRDAAAVRQLRRLLAEAGSDVVHAHGMRAGAIAALALTPAPAPDPALVVTVHNAPPGGTTAGLVYAGLEWVIARRADAVLCASGDLVLRMRHGRPGRRAGRGCRAAGRAAVR
jgi:hypothetical protein